jgi:hypothetical protein
MQGTQERGYLGNDPVDSELLAALASDMAPLSTGIGSRAAVLMELRGIKAAIRTWYDKQPDQVLREASAYSARLTELWTELRLLETNDREYTRLRTMQVNPVLDEIDRQYRFAASRIAMARQDIDMSR